MTEVFFPDEVNEVLSEISDASGELYENVVYLHDMTGWSYEELTDKVSRNCDYYGIADIFRYFADAEMKLKQQRGLWNEVGWGEDISF